MKFKMQARPQSHEETKMTEQWAGRRADGHSVRGPVWNGEILFSHKKREVA